MVLLHSIALPPQAPLVLGIVVVTSGCFEPELTSSIPYYIINHKGSNSRQVTSVIAHSLSLNPNQAHNHHLPFHSFTMPFTPLNPTSPICSTCGTQYPPHSSPPTTCFICDDPRQYVPPTGPSFTTLSALLSSSSSHQNIFTPLPSSPDTFISLHTEPKLAIGQRAILVRTPAGNILWDCLTYLDTATISKITSLGGLAGIVISHPHYYSTHIEWATAFNCPVYLSTEDKQWIALPSPKHQLFLDQTVTPIPGRDGQETGIKALKLGGHFPGSLVLLYDGRLLVADTLMTTPAGMGKWDVDSTGAKRSKPAGLNSFSFMYSIPNMIPLSVEEIVKMWDVLKDFEFRSTHGAFTGQDIEDEGVKGRVLDSMQIQVTHMGYRDHGFLEERIS